MVANVEEEYKNHLIKPIGMINDTCRVHIRVQITDRKNSKRTFRKTHSVIGITLKEAHLMAADLGKSIIDHGYHLN